LVAVAGWQKISKRQSPVPLLGRSLRTSEPSRGDSQELEIKCNHYESDTKKSTLRREWTATDIHKLKGLAKKKVGVEKI
jgi:hypothetical protein